MSGNFPGAGREALRGGPIALGAILPSNDCSIARGPLMCRSSLALQACLLGLSMGLRPAFADPAGHPAAVAIDDFAYVDTSGELADQAATHQRRRKAFL